MLRENEYYSDDFKHILLEYEVITRNPRTFTEYTGNISALCNYLSKDFLLINERDAAKYFDYLRSKISTGELSRKTFSSRLTSCRSIAKYIEENNRIAGYKNPFLLIKRPEYSSGINPNRLPSMKELDQLMTAAKETSEMTFVLLTLMTRTCMKESSILRLTTHFIAEHEGRMIIKVDAPTNSIKPPRYIAVPDDVKQIVNHYIATCDTDDEGHIFFNKYKHPLTARNVDRIIKTLTQKCGIDKTFSSKDLRNRGIGDLLNSGAEEDEVQEYIGVAAKRMEDYRKASNYLTSCPPDLVNYQLKVNATDENKRED